MNIVLKNKKDYYPYIILISVIILLLIVGLYFFIKTISEDISNSLESLNEPRNISYIHKLPKTASDINEKTEYLQGPPDEEYRYYLKAKISKEEFDNVTNNLKLDWYAPSIRSDVPSKVQNIPWWDPPSVSFLYAKKDGDFRMQADYFQATGYMYLYADQY